ncbi:hypothetical protein ACX0G9_28820 [Flavitalea flava]
MRYFTLLLFFAISNALYAQDSDFVHLMQKMSREEAFRSVEVYNRGKTSIQQREVLDNAKRVCQSVKIFLKGGVDTTGINKLVAHTQAAIEIVKDGIITKNGPYQTQRNLAVSSAILRELSKKLERGKRALDEYVNTLVDFRVKIDSLQGDSAVYNFPSDSVEIINYIRRIAAVGKELKPVDSGLIKMVKSAQAIQSRFPGSGSDLLAKTYSTFKYGQERPDRRLMPCSKKKVLSYPSHNRNCISILIRT